MRCSSGELYQRRCRSSEAGTGECYAKCVTCPSGAVCDGSEVAVCSGAFYASMLDILIYENSTEYTITQQTCEPCPTGAFCGNGECFFAKSRELPDGCVSTNGTRGYLLGTWQRESTLGIRALIDCPRGHEIVSIYSSPEPSSPKGQRCKKCIPGLQYILNSSTDKCQTCAEGMRCPMGDDIVEFETVNSTWVPEGPILRLERCPSGYYVSPSSTETSNAVLQRCLPCGKGEECTHSSSCVTCSECQAGYYKAAVSTDACVACPANTYRETTGASDLGMCLECQVKSSTMGQKGQKSRRACACDVEFYLIVFSDEGTGDELLSCQRCPKGAECGDGECALRNHDFHCNDGSSIVGDWVVNNATGQYELTSCPSGYELRTTEEQGSADLQQCLKCQSPSSYILRPDVDSCQVCPPGLRCHGDATLDPIAVNSSWVRNRSVFKLESCPGGYSAMSINTEGVDASEQQCTPCGKGLECPAPPCTECSECQDGFYKAAVNTEACIACPANTYGGNNIDKTQPGYCQPCPAGSDTNMSTGRKQISECKCSIGTYVTKAVAEVLGSCFR